MKSSPQGSCNYRIASFAGLFREVCLDGSCADEIYSKLQRYGSRRLRYMGDSGHDPGYIFRGELDYPVSLLTRIERIIREQQSQGAYSPTLLKNEERRWFMDEFERTDSRIRRMKPVNVGDDDAFWWLSAIQHYGGKTRLLDFTRDIQIALFFALEQHAAERDMDLMIYCFPCKDVENGGICTLGNKSPIAQSEAGVDINRAIGCMIELPWMAKHQRVEIRSRQRFGWDRAFVGIDRLDRQKGMFVYPYDYPESLERFGPSWLMQNLCCREHDRFNMGTWIREVPALRVRISQIWAEKLKELNICRGFTDSKIYGEN